MEQLGLMKNGPTSTLRERGGKKPPPKFLKNQKFRSFDRFRHVVAQKIQHDECNTLIL
jgi:hypothetical protein